MKLGQVISQVRKLGDVAVGEHLRLVKGSVPGSFEHQQSLITPAVLAGAGCRSSGLGFMETSEEDKKKPSGTVVATFPEYAIVQIDDWNDAETDPKPGTFWKVPFSIADDGSVTASEPSEVEQVYIDSDGEQETGAT